MSKSSLLIELETDSDAVLGFRVNGLRLWLALLVLSMSSSISSFLRVLGMIICVV